MQPLSQLASLIALVLVLALTVVLAAVAHRRLGSAARVCMWLAVIVLVIQRLFPMTMQFLLDRFNAPLSLIVVMSAGSTLLFALWTGLLLLTILLAARGNSRRQGASR